MLKKNFEGKLEPTIIKMAFHLYVTKQVDLYSKKTMYLENLTSWFHDAYQNALEINGSVYEFDDILFSIDKDESIHFNPEHLRVVFKVSNLEKIAFDQLIEL
jgi:hypothetical protein